MMEDNNSNTTSPTFTSSVNKNICNNNNNNNIFIGINKMNSSSNSNSNNIIGSSSSMDDITGTAITLETSPISTPKKSILTTTTTSTSSSNTTTSNSFGNTNLTPTSNSFNESSLFFDSIGSMNSSPNGKQPPRTDFIRRRKQQSKSQSYSNFNNLLPELLTQQSQQQQDIDLKSEHEYMMDFCLILKERLKQLSIQLEFDLSEIEHKDQEIEMMKTKINKYNMELREKEDENEKLNDKVLKLEKENEINKDEIESVRNDLKQIEQEWVQPNEFISWKDEIEKITSELYNKQMEYQDLDNKYQQAQLKIQQTTEQIKKERTIRKEEMETTKSSQLNDREQYQQLANKLKSKKQKNLTLTEKIKRMELEHDQQNKANEKVKLQLIDSEKENLELKHTIESYQQQLSDTKSKYHDLSHSQQSMTRQLQQNETDYQAMVGLVSKSGMEIDERVTMLMNECSKLNSTISTLEHQLQNERLTRQISTISLSDPNFSIKKRDLLGMIQEKDEEIQIQNKKIQRLTIDNHNIKQKSKKIEESAYENSSQLSSVKESYSTCKKELFKIKEELLILSNDSFNDSFDYSPNSKRKSMSDLSTNLKSPLKLSNDGNNNNIEVDSNLILSPIKSRPLSMRLNGNNSSNNNSPNKLNNSNNGINNNNNNNSSRVEQTTEEMLEKARTAAVGFKLRNQFLSNEILNYEKELEQQKQLSHSIISRLQLDLEESKKDISRIKKTFLLRFSKEDDLIFLDYFSMVDKFNHHPRSSSPSSFLYSENNSISNNNSIIFSPINNISNSSTISIPPQQLQQQKEEQISSNFNNQDDNDNNDNNNQDNKNNNNNNNNNNNSKETQIEYKNTNISDKKEELIYQESPKPNGNACYRCKKDYSFFSKKKQCSSCSIHYCSDCFNSKTKTCLFCKK